jgi:hypothetical protein
VQTGEAGRLKVFKAAEDHFAAVPNIFVQQQL